jgi:hypothetical protein
MCVNLSAWGSNLLGNRFSSTIAYETHVCPSRCGGKHNLISDSQSTLGRPCFSRPPRTRDLTFFKNTVRE